jgi:hypothetical protein
VKPKTNTAAPAIENQKMTGLQLLVTGMPSQGSLSINFPVLRPINIIFEKYHVPHANMISNKTSRASLRMMTQAPSAKKQVPKAKKALRLPEALSA